MDKVIDLHIHTTRSDGKDTPAEVLKKAQEKGLSVISITDHYNVDAYDELHSCRDLFDGKIIAGTELSTTFNGELIEVLGYGIDVGVMKEYISQNYYTMKEKAEHERLLILEQYQKRGIVLDKDFCYYMEKDPQKLFHPGCSSIRDLFLEEIKKHPENARFAGGEDKLYGIDTRSYLRNYYANSKSGLYVDVSSLFPSLDGVVDAIHSAGGLAFIAHGMLYSQTFKDSLEDIIGRYRLDGLECYHSFFTREQSEYMCGICDKHSIYKSGGSDYHGGQRKDCELGKSTEGTVLYSSLTDEWMKGIKNYV